MATGAAVLRSCHLTPPAASLEGEFSAGLYMLAPSVICREGRSANLAAKNQLLSVDKSCIPGDDAVAIYRQEFT
jgi:hypothetical protein